MMTFELAYLPLPSSAGEPTKYKVPVFGGAFAKASVTPYAHAPKRLWPHAWPIGKASYSAKTAIFGSPLPTFARNAVSMSRNFSVTSIPFFFNLEVNASYAWYSSEPSSGCV